MASLMYVGRNQEAHSCDMSCDLPCAGGTAGGGHRRFLAEFGGLSSAFEALTLLCPLDSFHARLLDCPPHPGTFQNPSVFNNSRSI